MIFGKPCVGSQNAKHSVGGSQVCEKIGSLSFVLNELLDGRLFRTRHLTSLDCGGGFLDRQGQICQRGTKLGLCGDGGSGQLLSLGHVTSLS